MLPLSRDIVARREFNAAKAQQLRNEVRAAESAIERARQTLDNYFSEGENQAAKEQVLRSLRESLSALSKAEQASNRLK